MRTLIYFPQERGWAHARDAAVKRTPHLEPWHRRGQAGPQWSPRQRRFAAVNSSSDSKPCWRHCTRDARSVEGWEEQVPPGPLTGPLLELEAEPLGPIPMLPTILRLNSSWSTPDTCRHCNSPHKTQRLQQIAQCFNFRPMVPNVGLRKKM